MKKTVLSILLIISMLSFYSCDGDSYPKVTATEAAEALTIALAGQIAGTFALLGDVDGVTATTASNGNVTLTFTSFDVSGNGTYTTMSGTIVIGADTTTYNLTFANGSAVTLYMVLDATGATAFEVNGHDMMSEVTITATH